MDELIIVIIVACQVISGVASHYDPGIMENVIRVRQSGNVRMSLPQELPIVDGYIAVDNCDDIGEVWLLRPEGTREWRKYLVTDCAGAEETRQWMRRGLIICELDWLSFRELGGQRHRGMRIERLVTQNCHEIDQTAARWNTVGRGIKVERVLPIERGIVREWQRDGNNG